MLAKLNFSWFKAKTGKLIKCFSCLNLHSIFQLQLRLWWEYLVVVWLAEVAATPETVQSFVSIRILQCMESCNFSNFHILNIKSLRPTSIITESLISNLTWLSSRSDGQWWRSQNMSSELSFFCVKVSFFFPLFSFSRNLSFIVLRRKDTFFNFKKLFYYFSMGEKIGKSAKFCVSRHLDIKYENI